MNRMEFLFCRAILILFLAVGLTAFRTTAQKPQQTPSGPPISFSAEDDEFADAVPLPDCVRRLLVSDRDVVNTLAYEHLSPEQLPPDWFTVSQRDLGRNNGQYLIVMGAGLMRGANINPFWIFRRSGNSCDLLLSVGAHDLEVLETKTNGLPDIKVLAATAIRYFEDQYRFDGHSYQVVERTSQPIGEELPRNLSDFETRKPLIQGAGQSPGPILCEARAWLWRQWWLEKPSYLKVILHSDKGEETTTTYFIRKNGKDLDVVIQTHRILSDTAQGSVSRLPIVEDEMVVAADVERRLVLSNGPDQKMEVPGNKEASADSYELYFNDNSGNNVSIL